MSKPNLDIDAAFANFEANVPCAFIQPHTAEGRQG